MQTCCVESELDLGYSKPFPLSHLCCVAANSRSWLRSALSPMAPRDHKLPTTFFFPSLPHPLPFATLALRSLACLHSPVSTSSNLTPCSTTKKSSFARPPANSSTTRFSQS